MGLYDSYKLTNSSKTEEFAGGLSANLKEVKAERDQSYLKTLDLMTSAQEKLGTTQYAPADAGLWQQVSAETEAKINSLAERGDLENALPEMYRTASQTAVKLNQLAIRNKQREEIQKSLDDDKLNLSAATKDMHKREADQANAGAQFDKFGRVPSYIPPRSPVKSYNNVEMVQKALALVLKNPNSLSTMNKEDLMAKVGEKQGFAVGTGESSEWVTPEMIEKAIQSALASDPGWRQSLEQDARTLTYMDHPEITDDFAEESLNSGIGINFDKARQLVAQGADPKEVVKKVLDQENFDKVHRAVGNYAGTAAFEKNVTSTEKTNNWYDKVLKTQEAQAMYSSSGQSDVKPLDVSLPGATSTTIKDYNANEVIKSADDNIAATSEQVKILKTKAANPNIDPVERERLTRDAQQMESSLNTQKLNRNMMFNNLRSQRNTISQQKFGKSFDALEKEFNAEVTTSIDKLVLPNNELLASLSKETRHKIYKNIEAKKFKVIERGTPAYSTSGSSLLGNGILNTFTSSARDPVYDVTVGSETFRIDQNSMNMISGTIGRYDTPTALQYRDVLKEAARVQPAANQETFIPFDDKMQKAFVEEVNSADMLQVENADGTLMDPEEKQGTNFQKGIIKGYSAERQQVVMQLPGEKESEKGKDVYVNVPDDLQDLIAARVRANPNKKIIGDLIGSKRVKAAVQNIAGGPDRNPNNPFDQSKKQTFGGQEVVILRESNGTYSLTHPVTGKIVGGMQNLPLIELLANLNPYRTN